MASQNTVDLLGDKAEYLLQHTSTTILKEDLHLPSSTHVDIPGSGNHNSLTDL